MKFSRKNNTSLINNLTDQIIRGICVKGLFGLKISKVVRFGIIPKLQGSYRYLTK